MNQSLHPLPIQQISSSWQHPQGAQAVLRIADGCNSALVVAHTFAGPFSRELKLNLPEGIWQVAGSFPASSPAPHISENSLQIKTASEFEGLVLHLKRK